MNGIGVDADGFACMRPLRPPRDLFDPSLFRVRIRGPIQSREKLSGEGSALLLGERHRAFENLAGFGSDAGRVSRRGRRRILAEAGAQNASRSPAWMGRPVCIQDGDTVGKNPSLRAHNHVAPTSMRDVEPSSHIWLRFKQLDERG